MAKESGDFKGDPGKNGERGEPGYTPVKGVDYYTEAEKEELIAEIDTSILGEIDAAFDELHAYAQALIGGGVTE